MLASLLANLRWAKTGQRLTGFAAAEYESELPMKLIGLNRGGVSYGN